MYSNEYDRKTYPPMPVVELVVTGIDVPNRSATLVAIVDSGADATFMPLRMLRRLGVKSVRKADISGISGIRYPVDQFLVKLTIGPYELYGIRVVGDAQNRAILGRDVLNQLIVTLNGLAHVVEITQ